MNNIFTAIAVILISGIFGLVFASPALITIWYKKRQVNAKLKKAGAELLAQYPSSQFLSVRYATSDRFHTQLKANNFTGSGFLRLAANKKVYFHSLNNPDQPVIFLPKTIAPRWIGYSASGGWMPWFLLYDAKNEPYYFSGTTINWQQNLDLFNSIMEHTGNIVEAKVAERLSLAMGQNNSMWFYIVGVLTFINTILALSHSSTSFVYGLATVNFLDGFFIFSRLNPLLGLIISFCISLIFIILGLQAKKEKTWPYKVGFITVLCDSIILFTIIYHSPFPELLLNIFFRTLLISVFYRGAYLSK